MNLLRLLGHLRSIRSVSLRTLAGLAATLMPDAMWGDGETRNLVNITLEVTYRCNLTCEFCFLKDGLLHQKRDELSVEEIGRLADQARDYGASVFITGGEPFLRRDLVDIVAAIKARGLKVGVNTNGLLVGPEMGRRIREAGLDYVIFSLHGPAEVHDCLEDRPGAFQKVIANLEGFAEHKGQTRVIANCVVARENSARLSELPPLLAHIPLDGLTFQHETFLTGQEVARHEAVWKVLFPDRPLPMVYQSSGYGGRDLEALGNQIESIERDGRKRPFPIHFKPFLKPSKLHDWYASDMQVKGRCLYIWTDMRIEPDGKVNACQVMPTPMGNVRDTPLAELLNNDLYRDFRLRNREAGGVFPACARCCKLYRNPMNFTAMEPAWKEWVEPEPSPSP